MPLTLGKLRTQNARSYLRKLCHHWSHRFSVVYNDQHGTEQLPSCVCTLDAIADELRITLGLQDGGDPTRVCQVVEEHVRRFAFQETLHFDWSEV